MRHLPDAYVKISRREREILVAACDAEILGKTLRKNELVFEVRESFYKGSKMRIREAVALIRSATTANLVGLNIVKTAVKEGLVHPEAVIVISGVPHAQIVKI